SVTLNQTVSAGQTLATLANGQTLTSPIAGTVVSLPVTSGAYVTAGEDVATVANISTLYANVQVPEQSISAIHTGQSAALTLPALPGQTFSGSVTAIGRQGATASSGTVEYPVTITIQHPQGILLDMSVNAAITTGSVANAVYVPTAAIQDENGQLVVLKPENSLPFPGFSGNGRGGFGGGGYGGGGGSFHRSSPSVYHTIPVAVPVMTGLTNSSDTQILSGLQSGQQVLVPNPSAQTGTFSGASHSGHFFMGGGF
ncbi:MAG: efflux RND transporter periplasmic adaptor subunit, partial [Firmicutes bacterium]|nr:efflux RND transporter periplasmic adaptor subunit [Bacillota bacterium]